MRYMTNFLTHHFPKKAAVLLTVAFFLYVYVIDASMFRLEIFNLFTNELYNLSICRTIFVIGYEI